MSIENLGFFLSWTMSMAIYQKFNQSSLQSQDSFQLAPPWTVIMKSMDINYIFNQISFPLPFPCCQEMALYLQVES